MKSAYCLSLFFMVFYAQLAYAVEPPLFPTYIKPSLTVVKIYNVNTLNETYQIDGYISFSWKDDRILGFLGGREELVFNSRSSSLETLRFWNPIFEFINGLGQREVLSFEYSFYSDGTVVYFERFNGLFTSSMDFKKFPFDQQSFKIVLESFDFGIKTLKFLPGETELIEDFQSEFWKFQDSNSDTLTYHWVIGEGSIEADNARWTASFVMARNPDYFYWQFYFPLALIVISTWFTFWISNFADRLSMTLSLLISVIAFNFFTSTLLPQLPYTTFIESCIILGYGVIFLSIIFTVFIEWSKKGRYIRLARFLNIHLRWIIPIAFIIQLLVLVQQFELISIG